MITRGIWCDTSHSAQFQQALLNHGWFYIYERWCRPVLKPGDRLLLRYPESLIKNDDDSLWTDYLGRPEWVAGINKIAAATEKAGNPLIIYTRPPQTRDIDPNENAFVNFNRITDRFKLYPYTNVSIFLDAGIDWNIKFPLGAEAIDVAEKCGIPIGMEPMHGTRSTWGLNREVLIASDLYKLQASKGWAGWRPISTTDKIVIMHHEVIPPIAGANAKTVQVEGFKKFTNWCASQGYSWLIPADRPVNYGFTLDEITPTPKTDGPIQTDPIKTTSVTKI